jgi:hypothetical protein
MFKHTQIQRLMFLFAIAGLFAITADFACLEDVCGTMDTAAYPSWDQVRAHRIETLDQALDRSQVNLTESQRDTLKGTGHLLGVAKLIRPIKHPDGTVEMPKGWLPAIPAGHPWGQKLTPADDAFYSYVEERIIKPELFDEQNPEHVRAVEAYLAKAHSSSPQFVGWTYAGGKTECPKKMLDAFGSTGPDGGP